MGVNSMHDISYIKINRSVLNIKTVLGSVVFIIFSYYLHQVLLPLPTSTPVISTINGKVQGNRAYSREGREYWQFLGIPYAQPPIGRLKFQPPLPAKPWVGIKSVVKSASFCLQFDGILTQWVIGQEDCLYLNVYTHPFNQTDNPKRPVLVHIHGGGFIFGNSYQHGPEYLMDHPIIVVTFQYRLGPFGFLNFNHDPSTDGVALPRGNMGMKDQLLVLKWVQKNIANFGGNPDQVTLYGDSAGGTSVHLHTLSPKSRGLFHRAYSHSGFAFCGWSFTPKPRQLAMSYAKRWNCPLNDTRALLDCLENYDPAELVKYQSVLFNPAEPISLLTPSVERVASNDRFLAQHPMDTLESGNFSKVPYIMGVNSADGGIRIARFDSVPGMVSRFQQNWTELLGNALLIHDLPTDVANKAKSYYFKDTKDFWDPETFKEKLTVMLTDVVAIEPSYRAAKLHAKSGVETHLVYYNYTPRILPSSYTLIRAYNPDSLLHNFVQIAWRTWVDFFDKWILGGKGGHIYGVCHDEDMLQVWNVYVSKWFLGFETDFSKSYVKMIADFVEGKSPVKFRGTKLPQLEISTGNSSNNAPVLYMLLDDSKKGQVISEPFEARIKFWKSVGVDKFNR